MSVLIFQASPSVHGATAALAHMLSAGFQSVGTTTHCLSLADYHVAPCSHCNVCAAHPGSCAQDSAHDDASHLLSTLTTAELLVFCAPIYFYHLPAQCKALIDRSQRFWRQTKSAVRAPTIVVLLAGRTIGEQLFQGSLLTLTYFFQQLSRSIVATHTLRGIEEASALKQHEDTLKEQCLLWGHSYLPK